MNEITDGFKNSRVEISGWTSENQFFVEKAEMLETDDGERRMLLRRDLPDGALIFVRWPVTESASGAAPHAYKIENLRHVEAMSCWEVRLQTLVRRASPRVSRLAGRPLGIVSKGPSARLESKGNLPASNLLEHIFP